jgi:ATP-binding cassette subfamily B protein
VGATRRLAVFLAPYRVSAVLAPLLMVLEVAMDLLQPRLVQRIVDAGIIPGDMAVVFQTGALMLGTTLIGLLGGMGCAYYAVLAAQGFGADLRAALFRKVQSLSFGNLDELETGALITRLTNDVGQVIEMVMMLLRVMVRVPLLLVGSVIMATLTSPQLAVLYLILIPAVLAEVVWIVGRTFPMFGEVQRRLDALNTVMQENLAGARVVKAFARAAHETLRFGGANERLTEQNLAAVRLGALTMPFMLLVLNGGTVAALWLGGLQVQAGNLEVGQVIAFLNYLMQSLMSLVGASMLVVRFSRAGASAERIEGVLANEPHLPARADALTEFTPRGRLAFEDVSFSYDRAGADPVLQGISFVVEPGETVAVLGATGSGKSSLLHLIPRFYDVTAGRVTLDGVDVRDVDEAALRARVGVALQEAVLFSGTVRENIRYGRPEASDEEVEAAARAAQAHDFIVRLPEGYDSVVGQRGVNLSGGQKQRLAIARALLVRPAVLLLDDSTSAVDVATEARIRAALAALAGRDGAQTRLVVAQRISTVLAADRILVLEDGRVAAAGTHAELLESSPIYREIYESQTADGALSHGPVAGAVSRATATEPAGPRT